MTLAALAACGAPAPGGGSSDRPAESLDTIEAHAESAFREGDYVEAQGAFEQALQIEPDQPRAVAALGTCYLKNRQIKKAEEMLTAHLQKRADDTGARLVLARVLIRQGELTEAAEALRTVLRAAPDNLLANYNLGFIDYRGRNYDEALAHLKRTIELKPDHPEAHYTLGLTYLALNRTDEAIKALEEAVAIDPRHVGARFNLANAYARAGRTTQAEAQQRVYADLSGRSKAAAEKEAQIKISSVRAVQFLLNQKYPEALAEYRALAARFPDHAPLYNEIGRLQMRLGRKPEAQGSLRKAAALDPRLSEPHYLLAELYREMGDAASADRELQIFSTLETIPEGKSGY
jgi:tetratricopeptide (TPR) repeat protein